MCQMHAILFEFDDMHVFQKTIYFFFDDGSDLWYARHFIYIWWHARNMCFVHI